MNILFVCSRNKWRSRTAETIFKKHPLHQILSAGTEEGANVRLTAKHLDWADIVFVMENKHKHRIKDKFKSSDYSSKIVVLEIPDEYPYMDEELIEMLKVSVASYL